ncbi:MAG: DUF4838 domain-containing protein, partial [Planctomycetota bacterium]|nr:DUF4838 domain-containing protein [Planctomycetota bacterium]
TEFTPIEPWAKNNNEIVSGKLQKEWEAITGVLWGAPNALMYKDQFQFPGDAGLPAKEPVNGKIEPVRMWTYDERGSFNAVCGLLRKLGVRWYLPGELGEIVPKQTTISLSPIDETTRPDIAIRRFSIRMGVYGHDLGMWVMRLGLRDPYGFQTAHGLDDMTNREEVFAAHPDWFAMYGGKRHFEPGTNNQLCYSNEELLAETIRNVRLQFDHFKMDAVSVMPPDGYTAMCQCPLCEGKDTPDRDDRGRLSDYVWGFVNRVAREVRKTHPDKKVLNCAYGVYTLPPLKIETLEPNVVVSIVGGRRPMSNLPAQQDECRKLREAWVAKTSHPIVVFENYPITGRGWFLPAFTPHSLGESVNATKGISQGEDIWLTVDYDKSGAALNHFMTYFTARMYWGGREADVDELFREYCRLFFGPAENEMREFILYCEQNWQELEKDKVKTDIALDLFAAAKSRVDDGSIYGVRIGLFDEFLVQLRIKSVLLAQKRGKVPTLRLVGATRHDIVIDGKLDDQSWVECPVAATVRLSELQTGRQPTYGTTVKSAWKGNDLYFAIRCDEAPGEKLNIATTKNEDQAIWYGDAVEILLETEMHSYYQIVVNPAGALIDLDRGAERQAWFTWSSSAEVATHVADDHWTVEIRLPVTQDENDPLHQVVGRHPLNSLPWHINICRQRIRETGEEYSAFSPTGTAGFHEVMKFAYFFDGRSEEFEADPTVTDYLTATQAATELLRQRQPDEALAAFIALSEGDVTPLQKSVALERAAEIACGLKDFDQADELTSRIPIDAVKKTTEMNNRLARRDAPAVIEQFADEAIDEWPFWQRGAGWFARGRAYALTGDGEHAETDLTRALEFTRDERTKQNIRFDIAQNREHTLKNDVAALAAYRPIFESIQQIGGATEFAAVQGAARILSRQGEHRQALETLHRVEIDALKGYWHGAMLLSLADAELAAGNKQKARAAWQALLDDNTTEGRHRETAEEKLKE